ncbi:MAG: hypothetical protein AABY22_23010, partial [Nanoarchaeota archaeon]
ILKQVSMRLPRCKKPEISSEPIWTPYIGKEIFVDFAGSSVMGVLRGVDTLSNYAEFLPALVFAADEKHAHLEREIPIRVSLSLLERDKVVIRHLGDGYLEQRIKYLNERADKESARIGFNDRA